MITGTNDTDIDLALQVSVDYTYEPAENRTYNDPGRKESVTIDAVWVEHSGDRLNILRFLTSDLVESLEQDVLESLRD